MLRWDKADELGIFPLFQKVPAKNRFDNILSGAAARGGNHGDLIENLVLFDQSCNNQLNKIYFKTINKIYFFYSLKRVINDW